MPENSTANKSVKRVLVVGMGGVGTIVAYGIDYVGKSELSVVVRRDYDAVCKQGFQINSFDYGEIRAWKPDHIYSSVEKAADSGVVFDFVVIATKNLPDFVKLEEVTSAVITPEKTTIVLFQNGFDLARPFFAKYPKNVVISGVSLIGSHNHNGVVTQTQLDLSFISFFENKNLSKQLQEEKTKEFISLYSNDKNNASYHPDAKWHRYRKLIYNATLNTTAAITGADVGRIELAGAVDTVIVPAMKEVIKVAKADGVDLPEESINQLLHSDDGDWFEPSMLVDVQKGNPIELEVILGNLLKVAADLKVETPTLTMLYNLLKVVQFRLKEKNGYITLPKDRPISDKVYK